MSGIKSLVTRTEIDIAERAHNCRRNKSHRINKGERRLKVRDGRSWRHYCMICAMQIVETDAEKLAQLKSSIAKH